MFKEENNVYWKNFCKIIDGEFVERKYWHSAQAIASYKSFKIKFDHYTHYTVSGRTSLESNVTRIYCVFQCDEDIELKMEQKTWLNKLISFFNRNRIQTKNNEVNSKYIITSKSKNVNSFLNPSISKKIISTSIQQLYIDSKDGIWGNQLENNQFEIATYVDVYEMEYPDLLRIKAFFEEAIDVLITNYNIKPI